MPTVLDMHSSTTTQLPNALTQCLSDTGLPPMKLRVRSKRSRGSVVPLVLHFHGGAFHSGDLESAANMAELLCSSGASVASVAYPLAPAYRFPAAVDAGYAALDWLHKERTRLGGAGAPLYVAGEEAGGNIAAAVAFMARDRAHPPLSGQILVAPMLDPLGVTPSLRQTMGTATGCKWIAGWAQYLRGPMDAEHPYAVPARALRLTGLPPALILTSGDDPMRDEALAYAERLREAGIAVHSGVLPSSTGWPDSLTDSPTEESQCVDEVRGYFSAFFQANTPTPPS